MKRWLVAFVVLTLLSVSAISVAAPKKSSTGHGVDVGQGVSFDTQGVIRPTGIWGIW